MPMQLANPVSPYRMTIDLNVLDHLADGLYSSVAAVITETVANAWDADAGTVCIVISDDSISITDDGIGMDETSVNDRYLKVGFRRRNDGDTTDGGRLVMGRKGIGKLSLFSIAENIKVFTKKADSPPLGLMIETQKLREAMNANLPEYNPEPVDISDSFSHDSGTMIVASSLRRERIREMYPSSLRRRLARRFSIIGKTDEGVLGSPEFKRGFRVFVNDEEVTAADREDMKFVEYLWILGNTEVNTDQCESIPTRRSLKDRDDSWPENRGVRGWIGTVRRPNNLSTPEGNLNSIVVLSRGRLVDEDILPRVAGAEVYTKYLTGQVEADFLDDAPEADIITSNRQRVIEDDGRFTDLIHFMKGRLREISAAWGAMRATDRTRTLTEHYPRIGNWIDSLPTGWRSKAEKLLERIATLEVGNDDNEEDSRRTLLRHAVLGFERLRLQGNAEELEQALSSGIEAILRLLADRDSLEASFYLDIVRGRLAAIESLSVLTGENEKERVLQEYLFDHLWILDPAWERATGSPSMEEQLRLKTPFLADDGTKERYGRIDIKYRTVAGKHVIVELKRYSVRKTIYELAEQGGKYVDALKGILPPEQKDRAQIEVVFVVGQPPEEESDRIEYFMNGVSPGSRITTYDILIQGAKACYEEYLTRRAEADTIDRLFDQAEQ